MKKIIDGVKRRLEEQERMGMVTAAVKKRHDCIDQVTAVPWRLGVIGT